MNDGDFSVARSSHVKVPLADEDLRRLGEAVVRDVLPHLPRYAHYKIEAFDPVPAGTPLHEAHRWWADFYLPQMTTCGSLPRQPAGAACPGGLVKVDVYCYDEWRGPQKSEFWDFDGFAQSVLVDAASGTAWDARGEET